MSQDSAARYLTHEWQSTPELYAKAVAEDPRTHYVTFTKNLMDLARQHRAERKRPSRSGPSLWRLRP